jgi:hypothetical protein
MMETIFDTSNIKVVKTPVYIYKEVSFNPTQANSTKFLHTIATTGSFIKGCYSMWDKSFPESTVNRCTMFFAVGFKGGDKVKEFENKTGFTIKNLQYE